VTQQVQTQQEIINIELNRISTANGNHITAEMVLLAAKHPKSPLHSLFQWDDSLAAIEYRKEQARRLIQSAKFFPQMVAQRNRPVITNAPRPIAVRSFLSPKQGAGYSPRAVLQNKATQRTEFIESKKKELASWCKAVVDFPELDKLRTTIEKLL
jgi:hypothetical protein